MTLRVPIVPNDAGGIMKLELSICVSMKEPCKTNKLSTWPRTPLNMIPVNQIGSKRITAFSSSTWVTVQSLHGLIDPFARSDGVSTAALSKKLK